MKKKLALIVFVATLSVGSIVAGDPAPTPSPLERKLHEIELSALVKQYEILQAQLVATRFEYDLLVGTGEILGQLTDADKSKSKALENRVSVLSQIALAYRYNILEMEKQNGGTNLAKDPK